ncbi:MAG TPA: glycosyltransferase family 39 protein [Terriglobales bacterium]|nr:glycosyltransferase family 39 protein [Terriglobales bacterium]
MTATSTSPAVPESRRWRGPWSSDAAVLAYVAAATVIIQLLVGHRYGFHRDELATLDDARHLAWGYVAYPPVTPFFARISLELFGTSLTGFRLFAAIAEAIAVFLTGLMARDLGGRRLAQLFAATAAVPFCLAAGAVMQYVSFDYLAWVLVAYFTMRLLQSDDPRWWLAIGAAIGFGMLSKYAMPFLVFALGIGLLLTPARRHLRSKWFLCGAAAGLLIFLPNLLWQVRHNFIYLDFVRHIHERDVSQGRHRLFLPEQLELTLFAFPLAIAGLYYFFFSPQGKRYRTLGWMYIVPLVVFILAKGRSYYLAAAYPMLYAAGSVWLEGTLASRRLSLKALVWAALVADVALAAAFTLPLAPEGSKWFGAACAVQENFREEIGWPELVETVAKIRDALPAGDRMRYGILAANYGEAGAINLYGPRYGLPTAISGVNSMWERGYPQPPPQTLIVLGFSARFRERRFTSCQVAAKVWNHLGVLNEETKDHPEIYVCRGLKQGWPEFWKDFHYYG